jgi:hypothetical protein
MLYKIMDSSSSSSSLGSDLLLSIACCTWARACLASFLNSFVRRPLALGGAARSCEAPVAFLSRMSLLNEQRVFLFFFLLFIGLSKFYATYNDGC